MDLVSFQRTVDLLTGPLTEGLAGRRYRVADVVMGPSEHELRIYVENATVGFCVVWDRQAAYVVAYPAAKRAQSREWAIDAESVASWVGEAAEPSRGYGSTQEEVRFLVRNADALEALALDLGLWQEVRHGRFGTESGAT